MMKRKIWAALVFSAGVILSVQADFRLESAKGKTYCIAVDQKSVQENAAAKHLQENLGKMFPGAGFRIVSPSDVPETRESVIYVGNTSRLRDQGIDLSKFGREEMLILQKGKDLYLAGGYPRGTLYSVFEFLENPPPRDREEAKRNSVLVLVAAAAEEEPVHGAEEGVLRKLVVVVVADDRDLKRLLI